VTVDIDQSTALGASYLDEFAEMSDRQDGVIYHYTTKFGLEGILKSKRVWATHVKYLNDLTEYTIAFGYVDQEFKKRDLPFPDDAWDFVKNYDLYVTSFSNDGNSLSQWRGYCQSGGGFSIGFSKEQVDKIRSPSDRAPVISVPCLYEETQVRAMIRRHLDTYEHHYRAIDLLKEDAEAKLQQLVNIFVSAVALQAARSKHQAFREEREHRLIFVGGDESDIKDLLGFHHRSSFLVPHLEIPLIQSGLPVFEKLIVGPTPHPDEAVKAAKMMLEKHEVVCKTVEYCDIPFRHW
jgi:hypothetical protein